MFGSALLTAVLAAAPPDGGAVRKKVVATRARSEVVIDGKADDEVWSRAPVRSDFRERTPRIDADPPFEMSFQVAYDDQNLYVFVHTAGRGRDVIARTLRRDSGGVFADDWIALKIDPLQDRRTNYAFSTNPNGVQNDNLALDNGRVGLNEWEAVWDVEVQTFEGGYDAEYKIPFYVLGLRRGADVAMGFNISIGDPATNANVDWSIITPPLSGLAASRHGDLVGLKDVHAAKALEIIPFGVLRTDFTPTFSVDPRKSPNIAAGTDARLQFSPGAYVEVSALTDFAQVNADQVQVARDRFPLFFPEQRPFFLNGLDIVNFGRARQAQLFFSRRVGLTDGTPVPLAAGAKVYGRTRLVNYAVLNVQTLRGFGDEDDPDDDVPPENLGVGRVRINANRYFSVGAIALGKHRFQSAPEDHFAGGFDAEIRDAQGKLRLYGFLATTWNQEPGSDDELDADTGVITSRGVPPDERIGTSASFSAEYRGLYVRPSASVLWSDEDFDPRMGFYRRTAVAQNDASLRFAPRPDVLGLQTIEFGPRISLTTDPGFRERLTREFGGTLRFNWNGGTELNYDVTEFADVVQDDFDLYLYTVNAELYRGLRHAVSFRTPGRFVVSGRVGAQFFDLFGGRGTQLNASITARPVKYFSTNLSYSHLFGELGDQEPFNFGFANGTVEFNLTRNLSWDTLLRLNLAPGQEVFGLQSRWRWRYLPGSDLFLVYRSSQPLGADQVGQSRGPFHELILKVNFYARALLGKGAGQPKPAPRARRRRRRRREAAPQP